MNIPLSRDRAIATALVFAITLISITPLCGLLFRCGCNWPWLGLHTGCNYFQPHSAHQCPWCASMSAGAISTGSAVILAMAVSITINPVQSKTKTIMLRVLAGLAAFVLAAITLGFISTYIQDYPLGLGHYLR